ncbi:MAG TPA: LacI family DNA-binding transcriptional regulator [Candidatus Gallacutalibacter stercoravium]|nr:LacI family DNA-binding transcriptional regulator [Candidatus Gallacutalibacter stercoravium]
MKTIKDVAKAAGVSVATVSRVLNHEKQVSSKTREQVLRVIDEIGYTPNVLGRNLRVRATDRILVLLPSLSNQFYSSVLKGVEAVASAQGYQTMISVTHNDAEVERGYINLLYNRSVDGILLMSSSLPAQEITAIAAERPLVMCSEYNEGARLSTVGVNNFQAAFDAVSYLINAGHRRIAMISSEQTYSGRLRTQGYQAALKQAGLTFRPEYLINTQYSFRSGLEACEILLHLPEAPTAVFAISDVLAAGVMKRLQQAGQIPGRDVDVFGFDNISLADMLTPAVSTVSQPRLEIGKKATELLLGKIADIHSPDQAVVLPHQLVLRQTTRRVVSPAVFPAEKIG